MRIPRIYLDTHLQAQSDIMLSESAARHVAQVLRLKAGARLTLFNGQGGQYHATINSVDKKTVTAHITEFNAHESESPLITTLIQGISRGERMDYTLQKSVELGVTHIIPIITERCGVKFTSERRLKRHQHWQSVISSACEQCGRNRLPSLSPPMKFYDWLESLKTLATQPRLQLVLNPANNAKPLSQFNRPANEIQLLIGPEGGLSEMELTAAANAHFISTRLGPRVLRTETAGVTALAALQTLWGDLI